jgi:hypothetical protein
MDVLSAEAQKLRQLVQTWTEHAEYELEATFGPGGKVNATAFFAIAQRLRSKGYEPLAQEDKLNIILPERIRFTITGTGLIQQYCRDDNIADKPFIAIIKDRTFIESNLDLDEYDTRIKLRREKDLDHNDARIREVLERWSVHRKAFRLIRRWSFAGKGVQFDLSIVRQTRSDPRGDFRWVRTFNEADFLKDPVSYEVEVELKRTTDGTAIAALDTDQATKDLIRGVGEVLRGYQNNSLLLRKTVRSRVLDGYKQLTGTDAFRGVAPVTLEVENMRAPPEDGVPNIRTGYNVTDKADGLRVLAFCDRKGELYMIDMGMNVYRTGLQREPCAGSLLDGEWITKDNKGQAISQLLLFDIYFAPGASRVDNKPFVVGGPDGAAVTTAAEAGDEPDSRYTQLRRWTNMWNDGDGPTFTAAGVNATNKLLVAEKRFYFAARDAIFKYAARTLDKARPYYTDGLIFTPNTLPLPPRAGETFKEQFKWKPSHDNTIDFLVSFEKSVENPLQDKVTIGINPTTNETARYKTIRLYVGSSKTAVEEDPRAAVLFGQEFVEKRRGGKKDTYRPIPFNPRDFPDTMAATCYRSVELDLETGDEFVLTEGSSEPIRDRSIVEMAYDPAREPGWRWYPLRIRHDKTERLLRGVLARTLNSEKVANSVWNSIHEPITGSMIRTGAEEPSEEEVATIMASRMGMEDIGKKYYERKAPKQDMEAVRGLRDFHNRNIKEDILLKVALAGGDKRLIDVGCGKAGDLQKWRRANAAFVLGVDSAGENIRDPENGAYRRYADTVAGRPEGQVAPMVFVIGDASKPMVDGQAGTTPEERDILRSIFARVNPEGALPPYLESVAAGALRGGADAVSSMFTLHYFFKDQETFDGLLNNLDQTLKTTGYFIGTCFDGDRVFNLLRNTPKGNSKVGKVGETLLWTITKEYDAEELLPSSDSFGMAIDVEFVSIGTKQREYLVSYELLRQKLETVGLVPLSADECRQLSIPASTALYDASYAMLKKKPAMEPAVKEFSFLNRWFIFKRKGTKAATEVVDVEEVGEESALAETQIATIVGAVGNTAPGAEPIAMAAEEAAPAVGVSTVKVKRKKPKTAGDVLASIGLGAVEPELESVIREVPVTAGPGERKTFAPAMIFQFYPDASLKDVLKIGDPDAGRWLSLIAPFPIKDEETGTIYPSVEHFYAGMKYKLATDRPALAISVMSQQGQVHQFYLRQRQTETGAGDRALASDRDWTLLKEEGAEVKRQSRPEAIAKYGAMYNDAAWLAAKDGVLRTALEYRWKHDKRLRTAVEGARNANKYLLYYTGSASGSELGGKRTLEGLIDGANKVGKILMELANFPAF